MDYTLVCSLEHIHRCASFFVYQSAGSRGVGERRIIAVSLFHMRSPFGAEHVAVIEFWASHRRECRCWAVDARVMFNLQMHGKLALVQIELARAYVNLLNLTSAIGLTAESLIKEVTGSTAAIQPPPVRPATCAVGSTCHHSKRLGQPSLDAPATMTTTRKRVLATKPSKSGCKTCRSVFRYS